MFTGIITDLGKVIELEKKGDTRVAIRTKYNIHEIELGASISCSGPCLTVVEKGENWFAVEVSAETIERTTIGTWKIGSNVNLERSLRVGEELGGHIVSGHIDSIVQITKSKVEGDSVRLDFEMPEKLHKFISEKGSVALDGVSLTVNEVKGSIFGVNIISHTKSITTFGEKSKGDWINLEIDMLARYVDRLLDRS